MDGRFVLYTEQTDLVVIELIDFVDILRINTFDGYIDVRLSRQQPHVTNQNIVDY